MKNVLYAGSLAAAASVVSAATSASSKAAATSASSGALPTVTVRGNAFWAGNNRFYIRGVDYQPGGSSNLVDPLADETTCMRDIQYFKQLGLNTIRVYSVDNTANHDSCMAALADAGIYVALDVNTPLYSINRADPAVSYNADYLQSIFATVDVFAQYSNTLLFFSGNEVINDDNTTSCAPYVKATTRDLKQYRDSRGYRQIPIGYSAADVDSNRYEMATYMNCGTDDQRSDFFAFNDYSWCDPATYQSSGWEQKVQQYGNYSLPIFLSEYGCVKPDRKFGEVSTLYGSNMSAVYSGGLVYEYSQEGDAEGQLYGLVKITGNDTVDPQPDFSLLQNALKAAPSPQGDGGFHSGGGASACPTKGEHWDVDQFTGDALPAMPSGAVQYLKNGAGKGPGFSGAGSQNSGTDNVATASPGSGSATMTYATPSTTKGGSGKTASAASGSSSSTHTGAASSVHSAGALDLAGFVVVGVVGLSTALGAFLL